MLIAEKPQVLIARTDLPANNLQEFIAYAKANQAKMQYGSPGAGSAAHLGCVLLNAAIGVNVTHVPYRGGAPAMQDLIAGRIDYQCPLIALAIAQIESKNGEGNRRILLATATRFCRLWRKRDEQGLADFEL